MTYKQEFLLSQPVVNGWTLTGERRYTEATRGLLARCNNCGFETPFGSLNKYLNNSRRCRSCEFYCEEEKALRTHQSVYKHGALKRNLEWSIDFDEFSALVKNTCHYCGDQPVQRIGGGKWDFAGIDRIDNRIGYRLDNLRPCCRICNVAKNNMSEKEWMRKIMQWNDYLSRENTF